MASRAPLTRSKALALASDASLGRFPGQGAAQNDNFPYNDNVDNNSPAFIDYVLPKNFQRIVSAKLSVKIRPFRSYNTLSFSNTGTGTAHHHSYTASVTTINTAGQTHTLRNDSAGGTGWSLDDGASIFVGTTPFDTNNTANESAHTHPVSGTSVLGVTESAAPVNPGITIAFDGVDQTALLGGPWNADQVEVDVTQLLATSVAMWHTVSLLPNQIARIVALLRISYYVDSRLSQ